MCDVGNEVLEVLGDLEDWGFELVLRLGLGLGLGRKENNFNSDYSVKMLVIRLCLFFFIENKWFKLIIFVLLIGVIELSFIERVD